MTAYILVRNRHSSKLSRRKLVSNWHFEGRLERIA